jgi:hypothetical protein
MIREFMGQATSESRSKKSSLSQQVQPECKDNREKFMFYDTIVSIFPHYIGFILFRYSPQSINFHSIICLPQIKFRVTRQSPSQQKTSSSNKRVEVDAGIHLRSSIGYRIRLRPEAWVR